MRVYISQPMANKSHEEFMETRAKAMAALKEKYFDVYDINNISVPSRFTPLQALTVCLQKMPRADIVYFCKGWQDARGCRIEHECAVEYNLKIEEE